MSEVSCSFVGGLSGLHTYFTSRNKSTYEHFRSRAGSQENPYDVNCARNWQQVPCLSPAHGAARLQIVTASRRTRHAPVTLWQFPPIESEAACAGLLHRNPAPVPGDTPIHPQSAPSCAAACSPTLVTCLLPPVCLSQHVTWRLPA